MPHEMQPSCCGATKKRSIDYLFWGGVIVVIASFFHAFFLQEIIINDSLAVFTHAVREFFLLIWWGILLGVVFVTILDFVPKDMAIKLVGKPGTKKGVVQAALAGVFFDLCSHGILLVGMKLYERGASIGQVMAFLIASPWNSLSLTIILFALIGVKWTLLFIVASVIIAILSGVIFDYCVQKQVLAPNPNQLDHPHEMKSWVDLFKETNWGEKSIKDSFKHAIKDSQIIVRWMFVGIVLIACVRTFMEVDTFQTLFAPTLAGLGLTLVAATVIEVCSEGLAPVAADLMNRAFAPGNAFTFLMAGVATDYTEIMGIKEGTRSWKIAFFLPLITIPQIVVLGYFMNGW